MFWFKGKKGSFFSDGLKYRYMSTVLVFDVFAYAF